MLDELLRQFSGGADLRRIGALVDVLLDQRDSLGDAIDFVANNRAQMTKALAFVQDHGDELVDLVRAIPDILGQAGTGIEAAGNAASTASRFLSGDDDSLTADRALAAAAATLERCQGLVADVGKLVAAVGDRFSGIPLVNDATEVLRQGGRCFDDVSRQLGDVSTLFGRLGEQLGDAGSDLDRAGQQLATSGGALRRFGAAASRGSSPEVPWALIAAESDLVEGHGAPSAPIPQAVATRAPARRATAKKTTAEKTTAKKASAKKVTTKKSGRTPTPAKRATKSAPKRAAKKTTAKKAPAKKAATKRAPAPKSNARKTAAKKPTAKRAPAKKSAGTTAAPRNRKA